jgi:histidinol-phosphatase (PHP family)
LKVIADKGTIVEINTGGYARGKTSSIYPSPWILERAHAYGIPVVVNSDAHSPDTLDVLFSESFTLMKEIGYKSRMVLVENKWQEEPL